MSLLLKNGTYINIDTLTFTPTDILVDETSGQLRFSADSPFTDAEISGAVTEDCSGKYIMHSFADGYQRPCLSMAFAHKEFDQHQLTYFRYLTQILWKVDDLLDKDLLYASALYAAITSAKNGTTFAVCRNESTKYIDGALNTIKKAFDEVGVSTLLSFAASQSNGFGTASKIIEANLNYMTENQALMGIAASYLATNEILEEVVRLCRKNNRGVLINVAEDNLDQANTMRDYKRRVVSRLYESGLMDFSSSILTNANYLDEHELDLINDKPAWVAQNPYGNFQRGILPFNSKWSEYNFMLGTDFSGASIPQCMRTAYYQSLGTENYKSSQQAFNSMNAVHNYIKINNFAGDGDNNLIVFDNPTPMTLDKSNIVKHLAYNFNNRDICMVISDGKIIVKNGTTTLVDEKEALKICAEQLKRIT